MKLVHLLSFTISGTLAATVNADLGFDLDLPVSNSTSVCQTIAKEVSSASGVHYIGDPLYQKGNSHWAGGSDQNSTCVVEPGTVADVSKIIKIVGSKRTPFGIRSGGHATNPGFSSTLGVQIALFKFSQVTYHSRPLQSDGSVGTVDVGSGLIWDDVYTSLGPYNVTVVGGRTTGIGIGGFMLGGGYSFLSNQYGLGIDNVVAFEVVLPSGIITTATATHNPDLFFGLKGGFNNFGIVTRFTLLAYPQRQVWGGVQVFGSDQVSRVNAATLDYLKNVVDPKAAILPSTYSALPTLSQTNVSVSLFYDGPTPPAGIFERYMSIPNIASDVSTRSMIDLLRVSPANGTYGARTAFETISLKTYSPALLDQILNQTKYWADKGASRGALLTAYAVEPFLPSMTQRSKGGAYPHDNFLMPLNLDWTWLDASSDAFFISAMKESSQLLLKQAIAEGQDVGGAKQIKYGNYASATESLTSIYGSNLGRLKQIKQKYDPKNVMSLAGGFKF